MQYKKSLLMPFSIENLAEIEAHLATHPTLSEGGAPGPVDTQIYLALGKLPEYQTYPNLHHWYLFISSFNPLVIQKQIETATSVQIKTQKADEPKHVAKSNVFFQVQIYDPNLTNIDELAQRILGLEILGLVWNKEPQKIEAAFGIQKLQIGCVIQDDKVLTSDIIERITAWEDEVQSVDIIFMQKL